MASQQIDYSLYLVTDSTPAILGDKDLVSTVKAAVEGGTSRTRTFAWILSLTGIRSDHRPIQRQEF